MQGVSLLKVQQGWCKRSSIVFLGSENFTNLKWKCMTSWEASSIFQETYKKNSLYNNFFKQ